MELIFINIISSIPDFIEKTVQNTPNIAYLVICFAMFLENIIPPIPSEIIMPLGGFYVYEGVLNFYLLVLFGLIGTVVGSLPWYYLGRFINEKKITNFIDKRGQFFGITTKDLSKSRIWFNKYGTSLVFWGRLVPGVRTLISVPAGIELMPQIKFLVWTSLGSLIWVIFLTSAGYFVGDNWEDIAIYIDRFKIFLKPLLAIFFSYLAIKFVINKKKTHS